MPKSDSFLPLQRGKAEFYYLRKLPCTYWYWGPVEAATRAVLTRQNTVVEGKCAPPSAVLAVYCPVDDTLFKVSQSVRCFSVSGCYCCYEMLETRQLVEK